MTRWLAMLALTAAACGPWRRPAEPDRVLRLPPVGASYAGGNGYHYVVLDDPGSNTVRVDIRYPVGSAADPVGKEGLAHLTEHLLFQRAVVLDARQSTIGAELSRVAHSWNAITTHDFTRYQTIAPASALPSVLRLEAKRVEPSCDSISEQAFEKEQRIVANEIRERLDGSDDLNTVVFAALYPNAHPYSRVASLASIASLTREDVCRFVAAHYNRGRAVVVVTGDASLAEVKLAAQPSLARLPTRRPRADVVSPVSHTSRDLIVARADIDAPMVIVGWPLPAYGPVYRQLELAISPLTARLQAFASTYKWGFDVHTAIVGGKHAPMLLLMMTLRKNDARAAIAAVKKSLEHAFRRLDRGEKAVWEDRINAHTSILVARFDDADSRVSMIGDHLQYEPDADLLKARQDELVASRQQARKTAQTWLAFGKAQPMHLIPRVRRSSGGAASSFSRPFDVVPGIDPVSVTATDNPALSLAPQRFRIKSGLRVVLLPTGDLPIVYTSLVVGSGSGDEDAKSIGATSVVGLGTVRVDHMASRDVSVATHVDKLLERACERLRRAGRVRLSDEHKQELKLSLELSEKSGFRRYSRAFASALYGPSHRYATPGITADELGKLGSDRLNRWSRKHVVANNATLIVVGQFDPRLAREWIEFYAGHLGGGSHSKGGTAPPRPRAQWIRGLAPPRARTVRIDIGFLGGTGIDGDHAARLLLSETLNEMLASLRERLAATYGFTATYQPREAGGQWRILGRLDPARAVDGVRALRGMLASLRTNPDAFDLEFRRARHKLVGRVQIAPASAADKLRHLEFLARYDLPADHFRGLAKRLATMTLADLKPIIARELAADAQIFGAYGSQHAVDAALSAAR